MRAVVAHTRRILKRQKDHMLTSSCQLRDPNFISYLFQILHEFVDVLICSHNMLKHIVINYLLEVWLELQLS